MGKIETFVEQYVETVEVILDDVTEGFFIAEETYGAVTEVALTQEP